MFWRKKKNKGFVARILPTESEMEYGLILWNYVKKLPLRWNASSGFRAGFLAGIAVEHLRLNPEENISIPFPGMAPVIMTKSERFDRDPHVKFHFTNNPKE